MTRTLLLTCAQNAKAIARMMQCGHLRLQWINEGRAWRTGQAADLLV
jgi:hypothetical protein